jgi:predicted DNA-binding transcriptional regulator AlpA
MALMKSVSTGSTFPEPEDFPRRRVTPSLNALPAEITKGRMLNSAQAAEYWGVSLPHWRRLYLTKKAPAPIRVGDRKYGWRLDDLDDALASREGG